MNHAVPHPRRLLLHRGRPFGRWLVRRWYDVRVHRAERFPATGPVVAAANHVGFIDGPLLAAFAPRPVHALTKQEMFTGVLGAFLRSAGQVPVDRLAPDPAAIRTCLRALAGGAVVGVFPEGTRGNGELDRFHRGAAYLQLVSGAPVVPVTFLGTREPGAGSSSLPRRGARIDMVVGEPLWGESVARPRNKNVVAERSFQLRAHMLTCVAEAQQRTGRRLPGPLPRGDFESLPGNLLEEHHD